MKYHISSREELSRTEKRYRLAKWTAFSFLLLFFYVIMRAGIFGAWQPVMLIPLCVAVSMFEDELSSCIFALFCGYMTDIAHDFVFGFSAVWLMAVCVAASLLIRNLIRTNLFNFCVIAAAAVFIEFSMDYLFNTVIWNVPKGEVILTAAIIPSAAATFIVSPAVYYLVKLVETRLSADNVSIVYYDDGGAGEDGEQGEGE
ncbi:MAG: hypothetical protein IK093_17475 [Ruminiclostridium sp.]|nr:hypothetical protein [Ruminiclostridium sp.]